MTTRPNPKQLATGTPEDGYSIQYSAGDSIWTPGTNSVFGRTGDVVAGANDYSASQIDNDSSVTGEQVSDALEYLDGYVASVADDVTAVSTMTVNGDLSGTLPNPTVTDLTIASEEQGSVLYFNGSNWVQLPPGEDGYVLTTHGTAAPTWEEASGGTTGTTGPTGTPFTVATITQGVPATLEMIVTLPPAPGEGDSCAYALIVDCYVYSGNFSGVVSYWVEGRLIYESGNWTCSGSYVSGQTLDIGGDYYPSGRYFMAKGAFFDPPEIQTTIPLEFITNDDSGGLYTVTGSYREIARVDHQA